jgi:hypothetical protein
MRPDHDLGDVSTQAEDKSVPADLDLTVHHKASEEESPLPGLPELHAAKEDREGTNLPGGSLFIPAKLESELPIYSLSRGVEVGAPSPVSSARDVTMRAPSLLDPTKINEVPPFSAGALQKDEDASGLEVNAAKPARTTFREQLRSGRTLFETPESKSQFQFESVSPVESKAVPVPHSSARSGFALPSEDHQNSEVVVDPPQPQPAVAKPSRLPMSIQENDVTTSTRGKAPEEFPSDDPEIVRQNSIEGAPTSTPGSMAIDHAKAVAKSTHSEAKPSLIQEPRAPTLPNSRAEAAEPQVPTRLERLTAETGQGMLPASGTSDAQSENQMKHGANRNESARSYQQELPVGLASSADRTDPIEPVKLPSARLAQESVELSPATISQAASLAEVKPHGAPPPAAEKPSPTDGHERLLKLIQSEVQVLNTARMDKMSVVLRPDGQTEILLRLQMQDGQVEAHARCDRGNFDALNSEWRQLQQTLFACGVRLAPLDAPVSSSHDSIANFSNRFDSASAFQNPRQPQNSARSLEQEGETSASRPEKPRTRSRQSSHLLELWA